MLFMFTSRGNSGRADRRQGRDDEMDGEQGERQRRPQRAGAGREDDQRDPDRNQRAAGVESAHLPAALPASRSASGSGESSVIVKPGTVHGELIHRDRQDREHADRRGEGRKRQGHCRT